MPGINLTDTDKRKEVNVFGMNGIVGPVNVVKS